MTSFVDDPKSKFSLILDTYVLVYEIVGTFRSIKYEYLNYVTHNQSLYVYHICFEKNENIELNLGITVRKKNHFERKMIYSIMNHF